MCRQMPEFSYTDLLPLGQDTADYRRVSADGIATRQAFGKTFLEIDPGVLSMLTETAMRDIAHLLRPGHLRQLRSILDDPQASDNDRFVARDLLLNACIAAGGVLPMCQDTGTAIVMGKRGQQVLTDGRDEEHIARGVYDAEPALLADGAADDVGREEHRLQPPRPGRALRHRRGRLQVPVHGQGRRLG